MARFERHKRRFKYNCSFLIAIPSEIEEYLVNKPKTGIPPNGFIINEDFDIVLKEQGVHYLFKEAVTNILYDAQKVITYMQKCHKGSPSLTYVLMVGGLSQSEIVQGAVRKHFEHGGCKVIIPREADVAVLKGAVLFGHSQTGVVSRISRRTYGFGSSQPFDPKIHDAKYKFRNKDNRLRCNKIFTPIVEMGDVIEVKSRKEDVYDLLSQQTELKISLYSMNRKPRKDKVEYTDDKDVARLGDIAILTPDLTGGSDRKVVVSMSFGQTEITVEAFDKTSGQRVKAIVD